MDKIYNQKICKKADIEIKKCNSDTAPVTHPNAETQHAIEELEAGNGQKFNSVREMMNELNADK